MRGWIVVSAVLATAALGAATSGFSTATAAARARAKGGNAKLGKVVLDKHFGGKCAACHKFGSKGSGTLGPNLTKIGKKRSEAYIFRALKNPRSVDPKSIMPPTPLPDKDLRNMAAYLASQK